jgi:hypothetical protein
MHVKGKALRVERGSTEPDSTETLVQWTNSTPT